MSAEKLTFYIAVWGALLSTILFVFTIYNYKRSLSYKIFVDCYETEDNGKVKVNITNLWKRPVSIESISCGIGGTKGHQKIIYHHSLEHSKKLNQSEGYRLDIEKTDLTNPTTDFSDEYFMFKSLWINVKLSWNRELSYRVKLDSETYKVHIHPRYDNYIILGKFFSRDLLPKYNEHFETKLRYWHR